MALVFAILVGVLVAAGLFRVFFRSREDFARCLDFVLLPNIVSLFRGKLADDWALSLRLWLYILLSIFAGVGTHHVITRFFQT